MFFRVGFLSCMSVWGLNTSAWGGNVVQEPPPRVTIEPRSSPAPAAKTDSPADLRLELNVVLIPVLVSDALDRSVTNLSKESFRILEDGVRETITSFVQEEAPLSVGLLIDSSGSMKNTAILSNYHSGR